MFVERLILRDFRNYAELDLAPDPAINVLHGENGAGKTNVLEAFHVIGLGRSHRGARDAELVRTATSGYAIRTTVSRAIGKAEIDLIFRPPARKDAKLNGVRQRRLSDLLGQMNVIIFSPEDLQLVKGSPVLRRRYLDFALAQASPAYGHALSQYGEALVQRNNLVRDSGPRTPAALLDVWDEQLVEHGSQLLVRRAAAMDQLSTLASAEHSRITGGQEELTARYLPSPGIAGDLAATRAALAAAFAAGRSEDLMRGQTLRGPHRDDIELIIAGRPGRQFASQGQQRTAALALKLAELAYVAKLAGEEPLLLLDDVFSELDDSRRDCLLQTISGRIQTFITTTNLNALRRATAPAAVFRVAAGRVEREQ